MWHSGWRHYSRGKLTVANWARTVRDCRLVSVAKTSAVCWAAPASHESVFNIVLVNTEWLWETCSFDLAMKGLIARKIPLHTLRLGPHFPCLWQVGDRSQEVCHFLLMTRSVFFVKNGLKTRIKMLSVRTTWSLAAKIGRVRNRPCSGCRVNRLSGTN